MYPIFKLTRENGIWYAEVPGISRQSFYYMETALQWAYDMGLQVLISTV